MPVRIGQAAKVWSEAQEIRRANPELFRGVQTSLSGVNEILKIGFLHPCLGLVIAKNKSGKTANLLELANWYASSNFTVLFATLEMNIYQIMTRVIANRSLTDMDVIEGIASDENDEIRIDEAVRRLQDQDIWLTYGKKTVAEIVNELEIMKASREDKSKKICLIIDYANLLVHPPLINRSYEMTTFIANWLMSLTSPKTSDESSLTADQLLGLDQNLLTIWTAVQVTVAEKRHAKKVDAYSARGTGAWTDNAGYTWVINDVDDAEGKPLPDLKDISIAGRFTRPGETRVLFKRAQASLEDPVKAQAKTSIF